MNNLQNVVRELAEVYKTGGLKTTRFSITLAEKDNTRLESIADSLEISKQELISKLLIAALDDLEAEINKSTVTKSGLDDEMKEILGMDDGDLPF